MSDFCNMSKFGIIAMPAQIHSYFCDRTTYIVAMPQKLFLRLYK